MVVFGDRLKVLLERELELTGCNKSALSEKIRVSDSWVSANIIRPGNRLRSSVIERLNAYFETETMLVKLLTWRGPGEDVVRWLGQRYTMAEALVREVFRLPDEADDARPPVSGPMSAAARRKYQPPPDPANAPAKQTSVAAEVPAVPARNDPLVKALEHHRIRCEQLAVTEPLARCQLLSAILADMLEGRLQP